MPNPLLAGWIAASVPKPGSRPAENEDATAADPKRVRFCVADGATEGWQSGGWARHLAAAFVRQPPTPADFGDWLAGVRAAWQPPAARKTAAWYAEEKAEQGSFATLVGLEFRALKDSPGLAWKAVAVGDSCLLVLRRGAFEVTFPVTSAADFGTRPPLVPSAADRPCPDPEWLAGWAEPGDLFLLASDAVAKYLLDLPKPVPAADPLLTAVRAAVASAKPAPLVESLLSLRDVLNDDASVVAVRVPDPPPPESHR